jgi:fluoroquinolone transport system permease protein
MKTFLIHLKWQFILLQKNNVIVVSLAVTLIYGLILFFLRDAGSLDEILIGLVLNDPSVIGYFFIALGIYTELKHQILPAILVTPLSTHQLIISKVLSLAVIGTICSVGLAISVHGLDFNVTLFGLGSFFICLLSALLGMAMLTFSSEFLKFTMLSIPIFLVYTNVPLMQFLGVIDLGFLKHLSPIQGSLDLIDYAIRGTEISLLPVCISTAIYIPLFYLMAYMRFKKTFIS